MSDDRLEAGRHHLLNGHRALRLGYVQEGRVHFSSALLQFRGPELRLGEAHAHRGMAQAELADGESILSESQIRKALDCYQELLELLDKFADQDALSEHRREALEGLAAATGFYGDLMLQMGRTDESTIMLEQARQIFAEVGDVPASASVFRSLGRLALKQGRQTDAAAHYARALGAYRRADDREGQVAALRLVADLRRSEGKLAAAEEALDEARLICVQLENCKLEGQILCALGGVLLQGLRYDGALDCFERARDLSKETGDTVREGLALVGLGSLAAVTSDLEPLPLLLQGANLLVLMDHHQGVAGALLRIGFEARGLRLPVVALAAAESARKLFVHTDPVHGQGQALRQTVKALATMRQGRATLAAAILRQRVAGHLQPNANEVAEFFRKRAPQEVVGALVSASDRELESILDHEVARILGPLLGHYNVPASALANPRSALAFLGRLLDDRRAVRPPEQASAPSAVVVLAPAAVVKPPPPPPDVAPGFDDEDDVGGIEALELSLGEGPGRVTSDDVYASLYGMED